jgi:hypothetical protein
MRLARLEWLGFVSLAWLGACSTLLGADFDDLKTKNPTPGNASGGDQSGNSAGSDNQGGVESAGGSGASSSGGADGGTAGKSSGGAGGSRAAGGQAGSAGASGGAGGHAGENGAGGDPAGGEGGRGGEGADTGVVVLNEVKGHGSSETDYVELYNVGPGSRDLGGYRIVDSGNNSFEFPSPTIMPENGYVLLEIVDENSGLDLGGPFECGTNQPICYRDTGWGIAQGGELVRLRNPGGTIVDSTQYPGEPTLDSDQSWGRLPDGSGSFQATASTPELENTAAL